MFTRQYWKAQTERAISAGSIAVITLASVGDGLDLFDMDWKPLVSAFVIGAGLSILKGAAANGITGDGPGVGSLEVLPGAKG